MSQSLGAYMMSLIHLFLSTFQHGIRAAIRKAFVSSCSIHDYNFMPYKIVFLIVCYLHDFIAHQLVVIRIVS